MKFELVEAVKAYALANYIVDGWDYVVECWSDAEIAEVIGKARSAKGAIAKMKAEIKPLADYRDDIRGA